MKFQTRTLVLALLALGLSAGAQAWTEKPKVAAESDRMVSDGYRFVAKDNAKGALKFFEKAVKMDKNNPQAWQALGDAFSALGKDEKAQDAYAKGNVKALGNVDAGDMQTAARYSGQGYGYLAKGDDDKAAHYFKAALDLVPGYSHARAGLDSIKQ